MLTLTFQGRDPEDLKLQILDYIKGISFRRSDTDAPIDTTPLSIPVEAEINTEPVEEIKPVISMDEQEENLKSAPAHEMPPIPSIEEVRAALKALRDRKGSGAVKNLLKVFGADSLQTLKPDDYLSAIDRAAVEV